VELKLQSREAIAGEAAIKISPVFFSEKDAVRPCVLHCFPCSVLQCFPLAMFSHHQRATIGHNMAEYAKIGHKGLNKQKTKKTKKQKKTKISRDCRHWGHVFFFFFFFFGFLRPQGKYEVICVF
jgi:hypothetical protein